MSMLLRTAVTLMLFLLPAVRQAEALDHTRKLTQSIRRIWQMQQGLPNGTVNCVFQSGDRYLWLGTRAGLARFDGITFTPIRDVGGIPIDAMTVRAIAEGRDRALWIATDRDGLICLKAGTARQWKAPDELPSSSITCLHGDRQGVLWVGTDGGVVRIDGGRVEPVGQACLEGVTISALCEMPDGCIVGGGAGNRLAMFCGSACTTTTVTSLPESTVINALAAADDGTLWIGSSDGLVRKDDAVETRMTTHEGLSDNAVSCITLGAEGSVWAGTRDGFNRIRGDQIEPFRTKDGLSQSTVHSICEDHEGTLWVGTKLGLNQFIDRRTIPFTIAEGMPSDDSGPIVQTTDGEVWIGTRAAGLARFDGGHFHTLTTDDGLPSNAIRAMAAGADGTLWVGTDKGLSAPCGRRVSATPSARTAASWGRSAASPKRLTARSGWAPMPH
jgi:ligand-binding sensor domain-containing protein